jgi:AcrR family transcriptional regulator
METRMAQTRQAALDALAISQDPGPDDPLLIGDEERPQTVRRMLVSAVREFAVHGFEGTTTRQICNGAGVSSAALYVYFPSKEALLHDISLIGHRGALAAMREALAHEVEDPDARLHAVVHAFVLFHAQHHTLARVIQYELRVLTPDHFAEVAEIRAEIHGVIHRCIQDGAAAGAFACDDVAGAALAIESLAIDIGRWFDTRRSSRTPQAVADLYAGFALSIVGHRGSQ